MKALCHAITVFVQAYPLIGRTGIEEASHFLSSGTAQPWAPVDEEAYRLLLSISALTPQRLYYPTDMRVQQETVWLENLAFSAQYDEFYSAILQILRQCRELYGFNTGAKEPPSEEFQQRHPFNDTRVHAY